MRSTKQTIFLEYAYNLHPVMGWDADGRVCCHTSTSENAAKAGAKFLKYGRDFYRITDTKGGFGYQKLDRRKVELRFVEMDTEGHIVPGTLRDSLPA